MPNYDEQELKELKENYKSEFGHYPRKANSRFCARCNFPVFHSELKHYSFQCLKHDEDLFKFETYRYKLSRRQKKLTSRR